MLSSSVCSFTDPDDYATAIRQGTIGLTVTERGRFRAKLCKIDFHQLLMQRLSEELARTSHVDGWGGRAIIVFRTQPGPTMIRNGAEVGSNSITRLSGGKSYYHRTTGPISYGGMSLPLAMMASIGEAMAGRDLLPPTDDLTVVPPADALERLQRLHATAGTLAEDASAVLQRPEAARGMEQALIQAMVECMQGELPQADRSGARQHAAIMRRFHRVIEENIDRPLYIPELCTAVGASERTLRTCCEEHLGMGPKRFLLLRRMHMVRRALRTSEPCETTVTETATRYGFWQFGRLAVEYKALFGEMPSLTLAKPGGA